MTPILGFIGLGFVGNAVREAFRALFPTEVYDLLPDKATVQSLAELAQKCDHFFLALPTPINSDGTGNFSIVISTLEQLNQHLKELDEPKIVVIKSSLPPGTTDKLQSRFPFLQLVFNPEFLTERNAVEDFKNQTRIILGGTRAATRPIKFLYQQVFSTVKVYETTAATAEMTKFLINCYLATKLSFFNEMYQVCDKLSINYDEALNLMLLDGRISEHHTNVPGWDGHFGFGGSCLPANINIMMERMKQLNVKPTILQAVWEKNLEVRPEKDWEALEGRCVVKKG
jgi:UDPglucose 6-dehydrogenase